VQVGADPLVEFGRISLDPAKDGGVIHLHAAVLQHELEIAVADGEHQIPSDRPQDHLGGKLPTFESLILSYLWCSSPSRHATASTRLDRQHKDATEPLAFNIEAGLFGGIAGCGMIGQTVGNVRYGGRSRLSTLTAEVFLLILMVLLRSFVARVPVAALAAIMIMVSISTFSWASIRDLARYPKVSNLVMLATVAVTVATHYLAAGVVVGVLLSGVFFAFKVMRLMAVTVSYDAATDTRTYLVTGQIFFASAEMFADSFDLRDTGRNVRIDMNGALLWDITAFPAMTAFHPMRS